MAKTKAKSESSLDLEENVASMICYIGTFVTGFIFFLIEKKNKTIRFHAMQSILLILVLKAYKGEKFKIPFIGDIAEKQA